MKASKRDTTENLFDLRGELPKFVEPASSYTKWENTPMGKKENNEETLQRKMSIVFYGILFHE